MICPLISHDMTGDERSLEAAAVDPQTATDLFGLAFRAVFENWRKDPAINLAKVKTAQISGSGRVPVILDGEKVRLGRSITIAFQPRAFRAIIPASQTAGAVSSL